MALTRAQLLMGNVAEGPVLAGQPQGVRGGGAGITIGADGVISVNSQSIIGVMKLGQTPATAAAAYNSYEWPTTAPLIYQQLTVSNVTGGVATLAWGDPDGIQWTAKGELVVGTGPFTQTLLTVGTDTSILVGDSTTASGLNYTSNLVTAMLAPSGDTSQRPSPATAGQIRLNSDTGKFEFFTGLGWEEIASGNPVPGGNTFVKESIPTSLTETGNALIPAGTTLERQTAPAPVGGSTRYNTDLNQLEVWTGAGWFQLPASGVHDFVLQTRPAAGFTASAIIPSGTSLEAEVGASPGWLRYNTDFNELQFFNGVDWDLIAPFEGGVSSFVQAATPVARNVGDLWYDTVRQRESVWDGGAWVQPGVTQTTTTGEAIIPVGTLAQRTGNISGYFRLRSDAALSPHLEYFNGTGWRETVDREGDNTTGTLSGTPRTITAGSFDLSTGNYWTVASIAIPNPTNGRAGTSGLIHITASPVSWGANFKWPNGSGAPVISTFPAIVPFYTPNGSTMLMGNVTEGIT